MAGAAGMLDFTEPTALILNSGPGDPPSGLPAEVDAFGGVARKP